jgi:alcohol dehydrogenase class IV
VAPEFVFGPGALERAGSYVSSLHAERVLLVTDPGLVAAGWADKAARSLEEQGVLVTIFADVSPNPRDHEAMAAAEVYAASGSQAIVAVGGGSPMDCAKAAGVVHTCGRHVLELEGVDQVPAPGPPLICIPTTAGTGAEVSQFAIITDTRRRVKIAIVSKTMVPDAALIDPETTLTMDPELTACTGMDAFTHAVEAYVSNAHGPVTDLFALNAIGRIAGHLGRVMAGPGDLDARAEVLLGSTEAGLAFSNAILGAVHSLAHSLGGFLDLPHGECNAILLPYVMAHNFDFCPGRFRDIGRAMGRDLPPDDAAAREALTEAVQQLKAEAGITRRLGDLGVTREDLPRLAANAANDPCMLTNPGAVDAQDLESIYAQAL